MDELWPDETPAPEDYPIYQSDNSVRPEDGPQVEDDGSPLSQAPAPDDESSSTAAALINLADSFIGYRETSNNGNRFSKALGRDHEAWCQDFDTWLALHLGFGHLNTASTVAAVADARRKGTWHDGTKGISKADSIYFHWPESSRAKNQPDHVGICRGVFSNGDIDTVEGNSNDRVQRNRRRANILGYIRHSFNANTGNVLKPNPKPEPIVSAGPDAQYRMLRKGHQFLTSHLIEVNTEQDKGAAYEGLAWPIAPRALNVIPLHRFYDTKNDQHFYTVDFDEGKVAGFKYDGIDGHVSDSGAPVYRFRRGKGWFWTTVKDEGLRANLKLDGPTGVAFYVRSTAGPTTPPVVPPTTPSKVTTELTKGDNLTVAQVEKLINHIPNAKKTLTGSAPDLVAFAMKNGVNLLLTFAIADHESHFGADYAGKPGSAFGKGHNMCGLDIGSHGYKDSGVPATGYIEIPGHKVAQWPEWWMSVAAFMWLARKHYFDEGLTTVRSFLEKYSPTSDGNSPISYTEAVNDRMNEWVDWLNR